MKICIIALLLTCAGLLSRAQTITQAEYFIDTDKGVGKNIKLPVTLAADSSFTFTPSLTDVTPGYHKLYIRVRSSNGKWSLTARRNIEVFSSKNYADADGGEYFFDTDPGIGKATAINITDADTAILQNFPATAAGLDPGYHKLYIRVKDSDGRWSLTARRNVEVIKSLDTAKVIAAEYFFANDPGFGKAAARVFANPLANGTFSFKIPYNSIPADADTLFIRVKDNNIQWSLTKLSGISVAASKEAGISEEQLLTGTGNTAADRFTVLVTPNPVKGNKLVTTIGHRTGAVMQLAVYNTEGKQFLAQQLKVTGTISKQINISALPAGSYILSVNDGSQTRTVQFLKE